MSGEALARGGHVTWRWADSSWKGEEMDQEALEREDEEGRVATAMVLEIADGTISVKPGDYLPA